MKKWLVGIDEAGRGPLAGPVAVGVVLVSKDFDWSQIEGVGDSKQVSAKNRSTIFRFVYNLKKIGQLDWQVAMVSASIIDRRGIVKAINTAMDRCLNSLEKRASKESLETYNPIAWSIKLDGSLKAPDRFIDQETIIKGDSKELVIGLASILAKVTRDKYMERLAQKPEYQIYDLGTHKGYGTKTHRQAIQKYGCTDVHRLTYCKNIVK